MSEVATTTNILYYRTVKTGPSDPFWVKGMASKFEVTPLDYNACEEAGFQDVALEGTAIS